MNARIALLVVVATLLGLFAAGGLAAAHAQYVGSTPPAASAPLPTAPSQVTITLSEAVQSGTGTIRVTNATGSRFDVPPVTDSSDGRTLSESLTAGGPGIYTVTWTATSAVDGHFTAGSFSYCVQDANGTACGTLPPPLSGGAPVSPLEVALRSIGFLGLAIAFGVGIMANFMWIPAGKDPDARGSRAYGVAFPVLLNVGRIASFGFIVSMAGLFALATGLEGNSAAEALKASSYVQSVAVRLALGIGLFAFLSRAFAQSRGGNPETAAWTIQAAIFAALAAVVAGSLGTHAAGVPALTALGIAADAAHFGGIGLWFGGLAGIVSIRRFFREPEAAPLARIVLGRFSRMAAYAVSLVLAGLLTSMTPAAAVPAGPVGPFALDLVKDGLKVHSEVYPPPTTVGAYTLTLLLNYASNGTPFYLARNGTAQFTLTDPPRPPVKENLSGPHGNPSNHFSITTTALSSPGVWKIDLNFRRLDSFDLRVTFYVTIKAGG